jgi:poly-gamma-glutamate capsule biosynthesis protein CapA/YwtB (metallophosphatase superfamily)
MRLALAGDTMLGRRVGDRLAAAPPSALFDSEIAAMTTAADLFLLDLECVISDRGARWPDPRKPFFFRAPPAAIDALVHLGVDCVTLANNHALDYGTEALLDTLRRLDAAGIAHVGAGIDEASARAPSVFDVDHLRAGIVGVTDHPAAYAAGPDCPGVAYADLRRRVPGWLVEVVSGLGTDIVVVTPHWGPNMVGAPVRHVRRAAAALRSAGATLVAGHSAHVFHGVGDGVLYDLGDFVDDYATHADLRNDLGLLWFVDFDGPTPRQLEAVPLALDYCHTRLADRGEAAWIVRRFRAACAAFGSEVVERDGHLFVALDPG